jgi:hypothetical protein
VFGWMLRKSPIVPVQFAIEDVDFYLDGGTTEFIGRDEEGRLRHIRLTQHTFAKWGGAGWLYLDNYRVPRRSAIERAIMFLLMAALERSEGTTDEQRSDEQTIAEALSDVIAYVESDQYGKVTE